MTFISEFLLAAMTALVVENAIFARSLGSSWMLYLIRHPRELLDFTGIMTAVTVTASLIGYPLRSAIKLPGYEYITQPIIYIVCMLFVYCLAYLALRYLAPKLYDRIYRRLADGAFNCAVLGALLIPATENMDLARTLGYGIGVSLGFAGAVVLIGIGIGRLELCHVPKAFKGLPIVLIYIGLLSLALYGLIGHQLPT